MRRWVDDENFERRAREILRDELPRLVNAGEITMTVAKLGDYLRRQPRLPKLVGATAAARILGIQTPHVTRLREQGRMPKPIEVEGSVDVYFEEDVRELARDLASERDARARKREERVRDGV